MSYRVFIAPAAQRQLGDLPTPVRQRVDRVILALESDPRPHGVVKLTGLADLYRVRVGDYRIVYQIQDRVLIVVVVKVAHRREVYR